MNFIRSEEDYYNILSIDGGGIRGLIPTIVIQKMEKYGYDYATEKGYDFPTFAGSDNKMVMTNLFDMTAGTSTGSIIAAGLAYPNNTETAPTTPSFNSDLLLDLYQNKGD